MKNILSIFCLVLFIISCSDSGSSKVNSSTTAESDSKKTSQVNLYLTSSGVRVASGLIPLLPFAPAGKTIGYITTASHTDEIVPPSVMGEMEVLVNLGFKVKSIDLSILDQKDLAQTFATCDLIWVCGGNTLYLLQEVRRSGFDEFVKKKIDEGIPYVGASAGSILLGPDIEFERFACDITQAPNLTSFEGLDLFPFATYVHFDASWAKDVYKEILQFSLDNNKSFITLRDDQFIHVTGEQWRVIDVAL